MYKYAIFTNVTNNIIIMFNSRSVLENLLASDLLILLLCLWVPILLDKEAWKDIENYLLFSLDWFMPGKSLITIPSNPYRPFRVGSLLILKKYKM